MEYYPINISLKNRRCLVVGGGEVASRKVDGLTKAGADVTVIASEITDSINNVSIVKKYFEPKDVEGFFLVIAATSDDLVNKNVADAAREKGILVNVVDDKDISDFIFPSIVDREPLVISISTSGISPFLSKKIRKELENRYGQEYTTLLSMVGTYRNKINAIPNESHKTSIWEQIFSDRTRSKVISGDFDSIRSDIEGLISSPSASIGHKETMGDNHPQTQLREKKGNTVGKVFLVGAGPGDPGLITIRALGLIETSDVILYDSLVNPILLNYAQEGAEVVYCGKQGGEESFPQDEINKLMLRHAKEGKTVVRLKGGDPWIFSRGAEEAEFLVTNGIHFEIVPGVPSPIAAAAYAGIPISHRDSSSSFAIATGHPKSGKTIEELNVPNADTIIYLMAVKNLDIIAKRLIDSGKSPKTPAALIQDATTGKQRTITATLGSIGKAATENNIQPPAIFIASDAVGLHPELKWRERLPLFSRKLVVTRPGRQAIKTVTELSELGAEVIYFPTIEIRENAAAIDFFNKDNFLADYTDIIFTSENGVRVFFKNLFAKGRDARALSKMRIYSIGPQTKGRLLEFGIIPEEMPEEYTSKGLIDTLPHNLSNRFFLLPRANETNPILEQELISRGAKIDKVTLYNIVRPAKRHPEPVDIDGVLFTSALTVNNFFELSRWPANATAFCIGPVTAKALEEKGIKTVIAPEATSKSLIEAVVKYWS